MKRLVWIALLLGLTLGRSSIALADGTYFESAGALEEVEPTIPRQRAIVLCGQGLETLIVESTLQGSAGDYAWVVPLPAKPIAVRAQDKHAISDTFSQVVPRPQPIRELPNFALFAPAALIAFLLGITMARRYREANVLGRIAIPIFEILVLLLLLFLTQLTELGCKKGEAAERSESDFQVEDLGDVGAYRVHVISGENDKAIGVWLSENGFSTPKEAEPILADYAKRKWCFLAAKIRHDVDGPMAPHPLSATFPCERPLYPMRLTRIGTDELRLELIVIGPGEARIAGMEVWRSAGSWRHLVSPLVEPLPPPHLALTYLRAELMSADMEEDFPIEWGPSREYEIELREYGQASAEAARRGLWVFPLPALLIGYLGTLLRWPSRLVFWSSLVLGLACAGAVVGAWYNSIELVQANEVFETFGAIYGSLTGEP